MQCFRGDQFQFPEAYSLIESPIPEPGPTEVRIKVEATGLGFVDSLLVRGLYQIKPELPYIPGGEVVGVVDAVGSAVNGFRIGQRVGAWQIGGGLAEYAILQTANLIQIPSRLDAVTAASSLLDFLTAWYALFERGRLVEGEVLVIRGAAGGVGAAAIQLGVSAGAHVIAVVSSAEKADEARRLGAVDVIRSGEPELRARLRNQLPNGVADVVFDPVCGDDMEVYFRSLGKAGRHLVLGFAGGRIPSLPANLPLLKSASLVGVDVRYLVEAMPDKAKSAWEDIFTSLVNERLMTPRVTCFALHQANEAFAALTDRSRIGKVVVVPE